MKKKWIQEYRCEYLGMNILKKVFFCKVGKEHNDKCTKCEYRGNEDNLKGQDIVVKEKKNRKSNRVMIWKK